MTRKKNEMSLSEALQGFVKENRLQGGLDKVQVREVWNSQMGPAIANYTIGIKLERDVLYVQLSSSVLREELSYGKEQIVKMLNEELGRELIKKLILR